MLRPTILAATAALFAGQALAEVTPGDVWQVWRGGTVALDAAEEREEGGTLFLDGVTARLPGGGTVLIGALRLEPEDGAVRVSASDPLRLVGRHGGEGTLTAPGASLRVAEAAGGLSYAVTAPSLVADWGNLLHDQGLTDLAIALDDVDAEVFARPRGIALLLDAVAGRVDLAAQGDPAGEIVAKQVWTDPALSYEGALGTLLGLAPPDRGAITALRLATAGAVSHVAADTPGGPVNVEAESAGTSLRAAIGAGRLLIDQTARQSTLSLEGARVPLSVIEAVIGTLAVGMDLPLSPAATPQDLSVRIDAGEVTLPVRVWERIDPEGILPRDPAAFTADLEGMARFSGDPDGGGEVTPSIGRLDIARLALDALGARASAAGRLAWPEGMRTGRELPEGRLALTFTGVEPLIDGLSEAGLVASGPALFAQLALSQFTRAQGSDGARAAQVVLGPDGSITIEGLRVR